MIKNKGQREDQKRKTTNLQDKTSDITRRDDMTALSWFCLCCLVLSFVLSCRVLTSLPSCFMNASIMCISLVSFFLVILSCVVLCYLVFTFFHFCSFVLCWLVISSGILYCPVLSGLFQSGMVCGLE